jgi:hypothetical protein
MKKGVQGPLLREVWVVAHENEGLITEAFKQQRAAIARAKQLSKKCPSMRTEVAKYLIAINSNRSFGTIQETQ